MRLHVLQKSMRHPDGVSNLSYPVELYKSRKAAKEAAEAYNKKAKYWFYHVRSGSLKIVEWEE